MCHHPRPGVMGDGHVLGDQPQTNLSADNDRDHSEEAIAHGEREVVAEQEDGHAHGQPGATRQHRVEARHGQRKPGRVQRAVDRRSMEEREGVELVLEVHWVALRVGDDQHCPRDPRQEPWKSPSPTAKFHAPTLFMSVMVVHGYLN